MNPQHPSPECHHPSQPLKPKRRSRHSQSGCDIAGCAGKYKAKGLCGKHYNNLLKFGEPTPVLSRAANGEPMAWIEAHKNYEGDDCISWPYSKTQYGYGTVKRDGRMQGVHCIMCEFKHGPAPTPRHDAAHSCGNGHLSCVNPNHVRWATRSGNLMDRVEHGTHNRGERHPLVRLNEQDVLDIRASSVSQSVLAEKYGVVQSNISAIRSRKIWGWLKEGAHV